MLRWLREHNAKSTGDPVQFFGFDVPGGLGNFLAALDAVDEYLAKVDPPLGQATASLRRLMPENPDPIGIIEFTAYKTRSKADRDALSVGLAELAARFESMRPSYIKNSDESSFLLAEHHLRLARGLDMFMRGSADIDMDELLEDPESAFQTKVSVLTGISSRDAASAQTIQILLNAFPESRIVLGAQNGHIQKVPLKLNKDWLPLSAAGHHLETSLGEDYVAIGVSCGSGQVPGIVPNKDVRGGFQTVVKDLEAPQPGSIDHLLDTSGPGLAAWGPEDGEARR